MPIMLRPAGSTASDECAWSQSQTINPDHSVPTR